MILSDAVVPMMAFIAGDVPPAAGPPAMRIEIAHVAGGRTFGAEDNVRLSGVTTPSVRTEVV